MIIKVADKRRDGKSSFQKLSKYITKEFDVEKIDIKKTSFDRLHRYIVRDKVPDLVTGEDVEKTIGIAIGNLNSLQTASKEMFTTASNNKQVVDPVYHYILSWPSHERPEIDDMINAAKDSIAALGMEEHQYIIAIHANTDNLHAHVEINRIHPMTHKSHHIEWAHKTLHRAARKIELKYGFSHDNGLSEIIDINGVKHIVDKNEAKSVSKYQSNLMDVWNSEESFAKYVTGLPAQTLKNRLDSCTSWQDVHSILRFYNIELKDSGGGGMIVTNTKNDEKTFKLKASKAFRFLKRKELEKKWGDFEPAEKDVKSIELDLPTEYKEQKQLDKVERQILVKKIKEEYNTIMKVRKEARFRAAVSERKIKTEKIKAIKALKNQKLEELKNQRKKLPRKQYKLERLLILLNYDQALQKINDDYQKSVKKTLEKLEPVFSYREYIEKLAQTGDGIALYILKGMIYSEKRQQEKDEVLEQDEIAKAQAIKIQVHYAQRNPRYRFFIQQASICFVNKDGDIAFKDNGNSITWGKNLINDDDLRQSLFHAKRKFGNNIKIKSNNIAFLTRVMGIASELELTVNGIAPTKQMIKTQTIQPVQHSIPRTKDSIIISKPTSYKERNEHSLTNLSEIGRKHRIKTIRKIMNDRKDRATKQIKGITADLNYAKKIKRWKDVASLNQKHREIREELNKAWEDIKLYNELVKSNLQDDISTIKQKRNYAHPQDKNKHDLSQLVKISNSTKRQAQHSKYKQDKEQQQLQAHKAHIEKLNKVIQEIREQSSTSGAGKKTLDKERQVSRHNARDLDRD